MPKVRSGATERDDRATSILTLKLLGGCKISLDNNTLDYLGSRKAQALFVYLAVMAKPLARASLTALFWPEMPEQSAKNNLRSTLTTLKKHLGPYLEVTTTTVAFTQQLPYQLDVELLCNGIKAALPSQTLEALQRAVDYYQGEFLSGFHLSDGNIFEKWLL